MKKPIKPKQPKAPNNIWIGATRGIRIPVTELFYGSNDSDRFIELQNKSELTQTESEEYEELAKYTGNDEDDFEYGWRYPTISDLIKRLPDAVNPADVVIKMYCSQWSDPSVALIYDEPVDPIAERERYASEMDRYKIDMAKYKSDLIKFNNDCIEYKEWVKKDKAKKAVKRLEKLLVAEKKKIAGK